MCQEHHHNLTRRDFLKWGAVALGETALACGKGEKLVEITATAVPKVETPTVPTLTAGEMADTTLLNGNIITIDTSNPVAQALAVMGDKILYVGTDETVRALSGAATKVIELGGKTVTPGLIDAHNHLQVWGTLLNIYESLLPPEVRTLDEMLGKLLRRFRHEAVTDCSTPPKTWAVPRQRHP